MKAAIKLLGSLSFAIFLIAALAVLLIVSTTVESKYGTSFAQRIFYQAGWFDVFLSLLAVNIFCSALSRWPYKFKHTGFLMTHTGILLLLAGSLLGRLAGVEGQIMLYENEKSSALKQNVYELVAHKHGSQTVKTDLGRKMGAVKVSLKPLGPGLTLQVDELSENSRKSSEVTEGGPGAPLNAAVEVSLQSGLAGFEDSFWLIEKNPANPLAAEKQLGPATVLLKRRSSGKKPDGARLFVRPLPGLEEHAVDLSKLDGKDIPLGGGFVIRDLRYYPDARVSGENKLISVSEEPLNPAVEFELAGPGGKKRRMAHFALFPQFESMHNRGSEPSGPELRLEWPESEGLVPTPSLAFYVDGDSWSYQSRSSKAAAEGALETGKTYETGWMDIRFEIKRIIPRAVIRENIEHLEEGTGNLAAHATLRKDGRRVWQGWLVEEDPVALEGELKDTVLLVHRKSVEAPFSLTLKDFRKVDYPGTRNAMAFESDVALEDEPERLAIHRTISMNKPLDYKGFRIFQSSFVQDPSFGEASVFTVAKNPGIWLIYAGAIVMFTGIVTVFFVKPLSSLNNL